MSKDKDIVIVISVFKNQSASVGALAGLEFWADTHKGIKLGSVGALRKDEDEINAEMVREADKNFLVSGAMGLAKSLLGPLALVGNVVGGLANSIFKDPGKDTPQALQELGELMVDGSVTLLLICGAEEKDAYRAQLESMCGEVLLYEVPQELLEEAAAAVEAAEAQAEAEKKAQKEAEKQAKKEEKEAKKRAEEEEDAA